MRSNFALSFLPALFVFAAALAVPIAAYSGQYGTCRKCVQNGAPLHIWDENFIGLSFCESLGMESGGDGDPYLCDARLGISRFGSENDPFIVCSAGNPTFKTWIGGEKNDLILLGDNLEDGWWQGLRDGEDLTCGFDVVSSEYLAVVRYGKKRDLMNIYSRGPDGQFKRTSHAIRDGIDHQFRVATRFVVRRYGNKGDLLALYGHKDDGDIVTTLFPIRDGEYHDLQVFNGSEFGVIYGKHNDVRRRFCWKGTTWTWWVSSSAHRDGTFPATCDTEIQ